MYIYIYEYLYTSKILQVHPLSDTQPVWPRLVFAGTSKSERIPGSRWQLEPVLDNQKITVFMEQCGNMMTK